MNDAWHVTGKYVNTSYTYQYPECNNRLGVDTNTESVLVMPDKGVKDVKNQPTKSSARPFVSLNTVQMPQHDHDPRIRPHYETTAEMMQPPSDTVPTLSRCCCFLCLFHKRLALIQVDLAKNYLNNDR